MGARESAGKVIDAVAAWGPPLLFVAILIGFIYIALRSGAALSMPGVSQDIRLPLLAIIGVVLLLAALAVVAVAYAQLGLTDKSHALALPEGSVRATIALSLVVLFSIIAVSLYSSLAEGPVSRLADLSADELARILQDSTRLRILTVDTIGVGTESTYTVHFLNVLSSAAEDFAKQLLILVGTLVTSVASFYFGSKAAPPQVVSDSKPPELTAVTPPASIMAGSTAQVQVSGSNLQGITTVTLVKDSLSVPAADVTSSDSRVKFSVTLDVAAPKGGWDVVAKDNKDRTATLRGGITVT